MLMAFDKNYSRDAVINQGLKAAGSAFGSKLIQWRAGEAATNYFFQKGIPGARTLIQSTY